MSQAITNISVFINSQNKLLTANGIADLFSEGTITNLTVRIDGMFKVFNGISKSIAGLNLIQAYINIFIS